MSEQGRKQFYDWLSSASSSEDSKVKDAFLELQRIYSRSTLREYATGKRSIDSIPEGKKLRLYEITNLACFKVELEVHPKDLDPKKILDGRQDPNLLSLRLDYDGKTRVQLAEEIGVSTDTIKKLIDGGRISAEYVDKIRERLTLIYHTRGNTEAELSDLSQRPHEEAKTLTPRTYVRPTDALNALFEHLNQGVEDMRMVLAQGLPSELAVLVASESNSLTLEQRIQVVTTAIGSLVSQMDYFRKANQGEREELARQIDPNLWGYVAAILPRIDKPESYETIVRLMDPPKSKKGGKI
jgi:plasmid maintenance system antidote protein VapI